MARRRRRRGGSGDRAVVLFTFTLGTLPSASPAAGRTQFEIDVTGRQ